MITPRLFPFRPRLAALLLSFLPAVGCAVELAPEFHVRGGLPNVAAKAHAGQEVRVAFLGGSITAADGWRVFILEHLRREFPRAQFTEIFGLGCVAPFSSALDWPRPLFTTRETKIPYAYSNFRKTFTSGS